jgi:acetyltransferase-like isoleucine patch superfamily enzyme
MSEYKKNIKNRSKIRFLLGLLARAEKFILNNYINWIARQNGAIVGKCVTIPLKLARRANRNLNIGNNTSIQTDLIDLRIPIYIGNNVIIGSCVEIITVSHNVDSEEWEHKYYGIEIQDYSWLATRSFILPSCRIIGFGSVIAAGAVVFKNVEPMTIVTGNPALPLRKREEVHRNLCVESLLGNDFVSYYQARKSL